LEHSLVSKLYQRGILNRIELDLYAYTDEKTAKSLQEEKFYLIEVDFKDYITHLNNEKYCAYVLTSPFMGYFDNDIQLGAIGVVANKITEVAK
jgi:predicted acetyltransferase